MNWAARRRFFIVLIVSVVAAAFLAALSIATFYEAPSCADKKQNQEEAGVDCGGPCAYLCTTEVQPPTVLFTQVISYGNGRSDVIASIENKNTAAAAKNVPYRITLYGAGQALIQEVTGTIDLPPGATVPVFVPGIASGQQIATSAFLSIAPSSPRWFTLSGDPRILPRVFNIRQVGTTALPRIEAIFANTGSSPLLNVPAVVLVRDAKGDVMAASSTVVPSIPAQGQAAATFTWNGPFPEVPASIEVVPTVRLP